MNKGIVVFALLSLFFPLKVHAEEQQPPIFVEIYLAQEKKTDFEAIQKAFARYSIERVHPQFFRVGYPPKNIAIGSGIPVAVAQLVMDLAFTYNRGITHLLPQFRFFPNQIAIGSSAFDERVPVPVRPEDVERLRDPNLSNREFHTLYRQLTGEKPKNP